MVSMVLSNGRRPLERWNMILVRNVHLHIEETENERNLLDQRIKKKLGIPSSYPMTFRILKESLDARQKNNIWFIYQVICDVKNDSEVLRHSDKDCSIYLEDESDELQYGEKTLESRPVVVGFGPAGMFSALTLAKAGFKPIVIEKGSDIVKRTKDVEDFWRTGNLDINSNVQFGEGGAGTFSDGKLTTRIKDKRVEKVIQGFIKAGAPDEIAYLQKPHVGTDLLKGVVKNIRETIIDLGGEVRFNTSLKDIRIEKGELKSIIVEETGSLTAYELKTNDLILCLGHSARDTYRMLYDRGVAMEAKSFAVGFRIEHNQKELDKVQYGKYSEHPKLRSSEYTLAHKLSKTRGVYTFCMCPGGRVVNASSEEGLLCVNGMSYHARNMENANSAIVVSVTPEDYGSLPLDGVEFQRSYEKAAYAMGGGNFTAPILSSQGFIDGKLDNIEGINGVSKVTVTPEIKPSGRISPIYDIYPGFITEGIREGLSEFGKRIKGFDTDGVMTGVETRTSSPLRILRGSSLSSINVSGIYPAGEGAGYAGGIVSSAVDGIKVAEMIISQYERII